MIIKLPLGSTYPNTVWECLEVKGLEVKVRQTLRMIKSSRTRTLVVRLRQGGVIFFKPPSLTACNFDASHSKETHSTSLERSQPS